MGSRVIVQQIFSESFILQPEFMILAYRKISKKRCGNTSAFKPDPPALGF
jgi:hypothetical protein